MSEPNTTTTTSSTNKKKKQKTTHSSESLTKRNIGLAKEKNIFEEWISEPLINSLPEWIGAVSKLHDQVRNFQDPEKGLKLWVFDWYSTINESQGAAVADTVSREKGRKWKKVFFKPQLLDMILPPLIPKPLVDADYYDLVWLNSAVIKALYTDVFFKNPKPVDFHWYDINSNFQALRMGRDEIQRVMRETKYLAPMAVLYHELDLFYFEDFFKKLMMTAICFSHHISARKAELQFLIHTKPYIETRPDNPLVDVVLYMGLEGKRRFMFTALSILEQVRQKLIASGKEQSASAITRMTDFMARTTLHRKDLFQNVIDPDVSAFTSGAAGGRGGGGGDPNEESMRLERETLYYIIFVMKTNETTWSFIRRSIPTVPDFIKFHSNFDRAERAGNYGSELFYRLIEYIFGPFTTFFFSNMGNTRTSEMDIFRFQHSLLFSCISFCFSFAEFSCTDGTFTPSIDRGAAISEAWRSIWNILFGISPTTFKPGRFEALYADEFGLSQPAKKIFEFFSVAHKDGRCH